jgi:glycosyltransferase involved in cell wall biosynthesis
MNILVVTAYPPVLHMHGGGVRMFHNIRILGRKHSVHVLSFVGSPEEESLLEALKPTCESVRAVRRIPDFRPHWLSLKPFLVREFSTPAMHSAVDETIRLRKIDVVQCEYLQMAQFRRRRCGSVLTAHEALSKNAYEDFSRASGPGKLKLFYRWMQMLTYETSQVRKFDRVITMTKEDAAFLKSYAPNANIAPVAIGIDTEEFTPHTPDPARPVEVLFVGNFLHTPNIEAAQFLTHEIAPRFPEISFAIHGTPLPQSMLPGANVSFPGYVPDTRLLYRRPNTIVAAPLFSGTGQRVKLLEAFAMACPVITTTVGAMGFPVKDGVDAIIADTSGAFAEGLARLAASAEYRAQLGNNGRRMILEGFTWDSLSGALLDAVEEAAVSH